LTLVERFSTAAKPTVLDNGANKTLWNIFYHLNISDTDLKVLQDHAKRLSDASTSHTTWTSSHYGKFAHILSESTLARVRKCWLQYSEARDFNSPQESAREHRARAAINNIYREKVGSSGTKTLHGMRSAGAHITNALETMSSAFEGYWKTGVTGGNEEDERSLGNLGKGRLNPMFAISSAPAGGYAVHYGSDPLLGFHLAEAFDMAEPGKSHMDCVVKLAKFQFRSWCDSFVRFLEQDRISIVLHCGEAVSLCHELQRQPLAEANLQNAPSLYVGPWTCKPLVLDRQFYNPGAVQFDVIDTSNLADHVGILNVLPAAVPLLSRKSSSVLYIETLLVASDDPSRSLPTMLCSDVSTMSLLLGLSPIGHLLGVATDSIGCEFLSLPPLQDSSRQQRQHRIRTPWKVPQLGDMSVLEELKHQPDSRYRVAFDAEQLGDYFFSIYLKMFAHEDWGARMSSTSLTSIRRQLMSPLSGDLRYYTRLSLVSVMRIAKANITTDWARCMSHFMDKVQNDQQLPIGQNSLQELILSLHVYGVREDEPLKLSPLDLEIAATVSTRSKSRLKILFQASSPPSIIHVALVVPRHKLRIFTAESPDKIGTPRLRLSVNHKASGAENSFFAIRCFFGRLRPRGWDETHCDVEEDDFGWAGSSDLIVTCAVPAYTFLLGEADNVRVALAVDTSPSTIQFMLRLGLRMVVYECGLEDSKRLWLLREAPGTATNASGEDRDHISRRTSSGSSTKDVAVFVDLKRNFENRSLRFHAEFPTASDESKNLASGANVTVTQSSPCIMTLQIGTSKPRILMYPFPVDGSSSRTRVARKSSWVDVIVPIAPTLSRGGYDHNIFPVIFKDSHPSVWGISHVNIQQQPIIKVAGDFGWLNVHLGLTLSATEQSFNALDPSNRPSHGLLELKESLKILFEGFVGRNANTKFKSIKVFQLCLKQDRDTMIFSNSIRHDRNTGSILMEAYVVCLNPSRVQELTSALRAMPEEEILSIEISDKESVLWKQLMPCLVERCRQTWTHQSSCGYRTTNRIPLSTTHGEVPICSCGEGKVLDGFPTGIRYKAFAKFATQIALAPIFAVPYVEPIVSETTSVLPDAITAGPSALRQGQGMQTPISLSVAGSAGVATATRAKCDNCGAEKQGLKPCARCGTARYCNHACQKAAWRQHKKVCNK
jgi:hypothetical protein